MLCIYANYLMSTLRNLRGSFRPSHSRCLVLISNERKKLPPTNLIYKNLQKHYGHLRLRAKTNLSKVKVLRMRTDIE